MKKYVRSSLTTPSLQVMDLAKERDGLAHSLAETRAQLDSSFSQAELVAMNEVPLDLLDTLYLSIIFRQPIPPQNL